MTIIILLFYIPTYVIIWYVLKYVLKKIFRERFKIAYCVILFSILVPLIYIGLGFIFLAFIPASEFPD